MNRGSGDELLTSSSSIGVPEMQAQLPITSILDTTANEEKGSKYVFITERGASTRKSVAERRSVRSHVMQEFSRSRRRPGLRSAHGPPIQFPLEIPQAFLMRQEEAQTVLANDTSNISSNISTSASSYAMRGGQESSNILKRKPSKGVSQAEEERQNIHRTYHSHMKSVDWFGGGRRNVLFGFPIEMGYRKHELLDHVFNDKMCRASFSEAWQTTSSDPAALYELFYWATLHLRWLRDPENKDEPHEALNYYANAVQIINSRVQDSREAISDVTIRLVIMLLFYNYCIGSIENWHIHINGLKEMIRLRGGVVALNSNPSLRYLLTRLVSTCVHYDMLLPWLIEFTKKCFLAQVSNTADEYRVDVGGSCLQDVPASFPFPESLSDLHSLDVGRKFSSDSWEWGSLFMNNGQLSCIFDHIRRVSALVDANTTFLPEDQCMPPSVLNYRYISPLLHMLLNAQEDINLDDCSFVCQEACRLAGILYLAEIRRRLGVFPVWSAVQLQKLEALFFGRTHLQWEGIMIPRLWVVTLAAIEATKSVQRNLFVHEMISTMEVIGLESYGQVEAVLRGFVWIDSVHGSKLKALYASTLEAGIINI